MFVFGFLLKDLFAYDGLSLSIFSSYFYTVKLSRKTKCQKKNLKIELAKDILTFSLNYGSISISGAQFFHMEVVHRLHTLKKLLEHVCWSP